MYKISLASTEWSIVNWNVSQKDGVGTIKTSGFSLFFSDCIDHGKIMVSNKSICHFHYSLLRKSVVEI